MNQDSVKELLLRVEDAPMEFSVVFSGKASKKLNGLYKGDTSEILIHNRNFNDDNMLVYTALHEYAHHLIHCRYGVQTARRAHSAEFWALFHGLLQKAESLGVYRDVFVGVPELEALTETIRKSCLYENGNVVKELGRLLLQADELCRRVGGRFEDYIDRVLCIPRLAAKTAMKIYQYNVNPSMGADNMKIVAGIRDPEKRQAAEGALLSGKSPDEVKTSIVRPKADQEPKERLEREKRRLERTIESLTRRLEQVERELENE